MAPSAISVAGLAIAAVAWFTRFLAAVLMAKAIRVRHLQLWNELGRPYLPVEFRFPTPNGSLFFDWCNKKGYLELDDREVGLLGTTRSACLWIACAGIFACLVWFR